MFRILEEGAFVFEALARNSFPFVFIPDAIQLRFEQVRLLFVKILNFLNSFPMLGPFFPESTVEVFRLPGQSFLIFTRSFGFGVVVGR